MLENILSRLEGLRGRRLISDMKVAVVPVVVACNVTYY